MQKQSSDPLVPWYDRFDICDKAIPWEELDDTKDFHIVWNPGHPTNPRFAFAEKADAHLLKAALDFTYPGSKFIIMSHWASAEAVIL